MTAEYRERLIHAVRRRLRSLGLLFSLLTLPLWTLRRLAEKTDIWVEYGTLPLHLKSAGIVLSRPQHTIMNPDPEYALKKDDRRTRDGLREGEVFYYADEFNLR